MRYVGFLAGGCVALCGASWQRRSRLLAPRLGRGSLCGNGWWVCVIFGGLCRFAQDDTVGRRGVVPNMFGSNVSAVRPPSSVASRHLPPRRGRLFRWCVALCDTSWQARSRLLAPRLGRGSLCGDGWWVRLIFGGLCRFAQDDTWGAGAWDGGLTVGAGGMRYVGAFACFALIRRFAPPSPPGGRLLRSFRKTQRQRRFIG